MDRIYCHSCGREMYIYREDDEDGVVIWRCECGDEWALDSEDISTVTDVEVIEHAT